MSDRRTCKHRLRDVSTLPVVAFGGSGKSALLCDNSSRFSWVIEFGVLRDSRSLGCKSSDNIRSLIDTSLFDKLAVWLNGSAALGP